MSESSTLPENPAGPGSPCPAWLAEIMNELLLSAYSSLGGEVAVVAINKGSASVDVPITIAGGTAPTSMTPHVTSDGDHLAERSAVTVTDGTFTATLEGMSVTTFVGG